MIERVGVRKQRVWKEMTWRVRANSLIISRLVIEVSHTGLFVVDV